MSGMFGIKSKILAVSLICALLLSGCRESLHSAGLREVDRMALVQTMGVDMKAGQVCLSVSTNPARSGSAAGETTVLTQRADSLAAALEALPALSPGRELFFGHVQHLIIGQAAAEAGLRPYLDYVERAIQMRLDTYIYVVKDGEAGAVLSGGEDSSARLERLGESIELQSCGSLCTVREAAVSLAENGTALIPAVEQQAARLHQPDGEGESPVYAGYALILDGCLAGYAQGDCARGVNLLTGKVRRGILEVPDGQGGTVALRLNGAALEVEPVLQGGYLRSLRLRGELELNLEGITHAVDPEEESTLAQLERQAAAGAKSCMEQALALAQELGADFYGLGRRLELAEPQAFDMLSGGWAAEFPALDITVEVQAKIARSYDISAAVPTDGGGN